MLTKAVAAVRSAPGLVALAAACGIPLGLLLGAGFDKHDSAPATAVTVRAAIAAHEQESSAPASKPGVEAASHRLPPASAGSNGNPESVGALSQPNRRLQAALDDGIERADALGGRASAAVWVGGDAEPTLSGEVSTPGRMWSMSKAIVTIAALEAMRGRRDTNLEQAMFDAIRRSDNCAIRRVILSLQELTGRETATTIDAFDRVLEKAGVSFTGRPQTAGPEAVCLRYLEMHKAGLARSSSVVAPLFGTDEWTIAQAIHFTYRLAMGGYGTPGARLLQLMGEPKLGPLEEPPPPQAPAPDWGAGKAFPSSWQPAWKAGWGGSRSVPPRFLAGQLVVLRLGARPVAVAAEFYPDAAHEPSSDNPGITPAPKALELIFRAVREALREGVR